MDSITGGQNGIETLKNIEKNEDGEGGESVVPVVRMGAGHWQDARRPGCPVTISRTFLCVCARQGQKKGSSAILALLELLLGWALAWWHGAGSVSVCACVLHYVVACLTGLEVTW